MPDALPLYDARRSAWRGAGRALIMAHRTSVPDRLFAGQRLAKTVCATICATFALETYRPLKTVKTRFVANVYRVKRNLNETQ